LRKLRAFASAAGLPDEPENKDDLNCVCVSPGESNEMECCTLDGDCKITFCPYVDTMCFSVENGSDECRAIDESLIIKGEEPDDESVEFDDDSVMEDSTSKDAGRRRIEDRLAVFNETARRRLCDEFDSCVHYDRCPNSMNRLYMQKRNLAYKEYHWRGQCLKYSGKSDKETLNNMRPNGIRLTNGIVVGNHKRVQKRHCRSDEICWSGSTEWFGDGAWPQTRSGCGWERLCRKRRCWCQNPNETGYGKNKCESGSSTGYWRASTSSRGHWVEEYHAWCHPSQVCRATGMEYFPVGGWSRGNWNHMCQA